MSNTVILHIDTGEVIYESTDKTLPKLDGSLSLGLLAIEALNQGVSLKGADLIGASFNGANLIRSNFDGANLYKASFNNCYLQQVSFRDAYLIQASFKEVISIGCNFSRANMSGIDLHNASICKPRMESVICNNVPVIEDIHKKVYEATSPIGSLDIDNYHTSDTVHDRAGWVVHLAGTEGKVLEKKWGTINAALMIYAVSDPGLFVGDYYMDFFASESDTISDIYACYKPEGNMEDPITVTFTYVWNNLKLDVEVKLVLNTRLNTYDGEVISCAIGGTEVDLSQALIHHNLHLEDALIQEARERAEG